MAPFFVHLGGLLKRRTWFREGKRATKGAVRNRRPLTRVRPVLELLESRICPSSYYSYTVIAKTGDTVTTSAGSATLTAVGDSPGINDSGNIAFTGTVQGGRQGVFIASGSATPTDLDSAPAFNFGRDVWINNNNQVMAHAQDSAGLTARLL